MLTTKPLFIFFVFFTLQQPSFAQKDIKSYEWLEIDKFVDGDTFWVINTKGNRD